MRLVWRLPNVHAVDTIIFEHENLWWLFFNGSTKSRHGLNSRPMAFYSKQPISGEWLPHEQNPLVCDSRIGRNGGILDAGSDHPIRCRQKQGFNTYGAGLSLARITELTPKTYREEQIGEIEPLFFDKIKGCHHMHSNGQYTVFDFFPAKRGQN